MWFIKNTDSKQFSGFSVENSLFYISYQVVNIYRQKKKKKSGGFKYKAKHYSNFEEKKRGDDLLDLELGKRFLGMTLKTWTIQENI